MRFCADLLYVCISVGAFYPLVSIIHLYLIFNIILYILSYIYISIAFLAKILRMIKIKIVDMKKTIIIVMTLTTMIKYST